MLFSLNGCVFFFQVSFGKQKNVITARLTDYSMEHLQFTLEAIFELLTPLLKMGQCFVV